VSEAKPIAWIRSISVLGMIFAAAYLGGVVEVVSWSFIHRDDLGVLRFLPFAMLILPVAAGAFMSAHLARLIGLSIARNWPLAMLWAYMAAGGLWTRLHYHSTESFFSHALAMTTFFFAWAFATRASPAGTVMPLLRATAPFWVIMLGVVCYGFATGEHLAHEIMYVFAPLPLFWGLRTDRQWVRAAAAFAILAMAALGLKNTTLVIGALSLYFLWVFSHPAVRSGDRAPFNLKAVVLLAVVGAVAYAGWTELSNHVEDFSSGNTDFRKYNYARLWAKFLQSPIWGDRFIGTPNLIFDLYEIDVGNQVLPSHSDTLDILAHGGLLGFACWLGFVVALVRGFLATCAPAASRDEYAARITLFAVSVGALFTMCVNPVWANTTNAFMFWASLGLFRAITDPHRDHERGRWWRPNIPAEQEARHPVAA
jgi:O-antigen ligase